MSISWSTSKAGYDPGQSQSLKITFDSRDVGKVKISYVFKAHSLGQDDYVYSQRRNVVTISAGNNSTTFKYQLHGNKASTTKTGSFYVNNVANGIKSLDVYYKNDRVGTNTPNYGPKSTGKVSKTKIGSLPISDNTKYSINYYSGYRDGVVSNLPESKTDVYKGTTYKISNSVPIDVKNHYVFNLGYTTTFDSEINIVDPTHRLDSTQTLTSNVSYYACWSPQSYVYRFFTSNNFNKSYTDPLNGGDLVRSYTYNQNDSVYLPNLNDYSNNNSTVNEYYKVGYKFNGWNSIRGNISLNDLRCSFDSDVNFYPDWSPINSKIIFNYGFNNYTRE
ncbi:MAG: hypothetical protein IJH55_04005, partial [Romboutsia sp.]|nr:hypothetical protein [Romboutsia sp.]